MLNRFSGLSSASTGSRVLHFRHHSNLQNITRPLRSRAFHTSPKCQSSLLDVCYSQAHTVITGLHSLTGLPWVVTLPLTAFLVRAVVISPLSIYSHRITRRQLALQPLLQAWRFPLQRKVFKETAALGPSAAQKKLLKALASKRRELNKRFGTGNWKRFLPVLQLPVWLIVIETIRKMCGTHAGLLGLLTRTSQEAVEQPGTDSVAEVSPSVVPVEESFSGGVALWFPDLLLPDPLLILPFVLSGSLFANIHFNSSRPGVTPSNFSRRLTNTLKILALAIGPATLQVPAAMLIYWISSSLFALGQHAILEWYMPASPSVKPCRPRQRQDMIGFTRQP